MRIRLVGVRCIRYFFAARQVVPLRNLQVAGLNITLIFASESRIAHASQRATPTIIQAFLGEILAPFDLSLAGIAFSIGPSS